MTDISTIPQIMPVLSPGRHRRPSQGACFMEFASYLAGERWSDHPQCTHPLLAFLARGINDFSSDEGRARLAPYIPSVIGLTSADPRMDVMIALRAASYAMPVASESRQRALAAGVRACEKMLLALDGSIPAETAEIVATASRVAPAAWAWAEDFSRGLEPRRGLSFTRQGRAIVSTSVVGIAHACIADSDALLLALIDAVIGDCLSLIDSGSESTGSDYVTTENFTTGATATEPLSVAY